MQKGAHGRRSLGSYIRKQVSNLVVQRFIDEGYVAIPLGPGCDREMYRMMPFGKLMRFNDTKMEYDAVFIEFMDNRFFTMRIEVMNHPLEVIDLSGRTVPAERISPMDVENYYEYIKYPDNFDTLFGSFGNFTCKKLLFPVKQEDVDKMIAEIAAYLPEIDDALHFDRLGPHIRKYAFRGALRETAATRAVGRTE